MGIIGATIEQKSDSKTKYWAIAGLIISWTTFGIFLLSPFGFIAWIGILIYLISKRTHLKWYVVFSAWIFVPSCNLLTGTARYFTGTASLQGVGGPETYHGIDRETRVPSISSGCIFVGFEPFTFPSNNAAIKLCTNLFGYQRGAYTGIYPTEDEAQKIIKTADTISLTQSNDYYEFITDNISIRIDTSEFYRFRHQREPLKKVVGKIKDNECFVFQPIDQKENYVNEIYLVDIENERLLIRYFQYN